MNTPSAIVISAALIAGAFVLSSGTQANHPHERAAHIVTPDGGVSHMHGDKVHHCDLDQKEASTSTGLRCGDWQ